MGNVVSGATPAMAPTAALESFAAELPDFADVEEAVIISNTRCAAACATLAECGRLTRFHCSFLKTVRVKQASLTYTVKIFATPSNMDIAPHVLGLKRQQALIVESTNASLPFLRCDQNRNGWGVTVRQHLYTSLYDRISTRPFFSLVEKKWVTYQLLSSLADWYAPARLNSVTLVLTHSLLAVTVLASVTATSRQKTCC